ncbi:MAG: PAS domain S-box protein [Deltaproteobacteria bacterium]|nr:PAS domain S-box protein [Deltaproteobacteria bacterium]
MSQLKKQLNDNKLSEKEENLSKLYKNVVENLNQGIWIGKRKNRTLATLYWNKGAERISGLKKDQLKKLNLLKILPGLKQILKEIKSNPNKGKKEE